MSIEAITTTPVAIDTTKELVGFPAITYTRDQLDLIKRTYAADSTDDEFVLFVHASKRLNLDILARQIHFTKRAGKCVFIVSIDGYRLNAERTGKYAPGREPTFAYDDDGDIISATSYVKKLIIGEWHEAAATAFMDEFLPEEEKAAWMWRKMPHNQLAKCAEALCLRKAFPKELGDTVTEEEMEQVRGPVNVTPIKSPESKPQSAHISTESSSRDLISEAQGKRLYAIWKSAEKSDGDVKAYINKKYGIDSTNQIKKSDYEAICLWAGTGDAQ